MSLSDKTKVKPEKEVIPRWKKIMDLPPTTKMWDISTGKIYTVEQFVPLYKGELSNRVDNFKIKFTDDEVYVPFLRLIEDKSTCSLVNS